MKKLTLLLSILVLAVSCGKEESSDSTDGVGSSDHRVFVSSVSYTGGIIGGLSGANTKCADLAKAAGLKLDYVAILSDATKNASETLIFTGSVYTVASKSNLVSATGSDLWDTDTTNLLNLINIDENGSTVTDANPWTGSTEEGKVFGSDCNNWTSSATTGQTGNIGKLDSEWIERNTDNCSNEHRLYCISQQK